MVIDMQVALLLNYVKAKTNKNRIEKSELQIILIVIPATAKL